MGFNPAIGSTRRLGVGSPATLILLALLAATAGHAFGQTAPADLPQTPQAQQTGVAGLPNQPLQSARDAQAAASNPSGLSWDDVKAKLESKNPTLKADAVNVEEMKAEEITAFLRPNPTFTLGADGTQIAPHNGSWQPLRGTAPSPNFSYLHERQGKRELRLESAKQGTQISVSQHADLERTLLFNLRSQFVATLQAKAVLALTREELDYYDHLIEISRLRWQNGDIAQIDFERIDLQRVQYESDLETAIVNLRQAKIILLQLLDDKTPVETFDVKGNFDYIDQLQPVEEFQHTALDNRPDLKAAYQSVQQAYTNNRLAIANGSTDPTFGAWYTYNGSFNNTATQYIGLSVSVPLRIFDQKPGREGTHAVGHHQESAPAGCGQRAGLLRCRFGLRAGGEHAASAGGLAKAHYLDQATHVRDTVTFAYQHGGASLLDLLNAQSDFRNVELAYLQLIGTYLTAAGQLNLAVGREVIQ